MAQRKNSRLERRDYRMLPCAQLGAVEGGQTSPPIPTPAFSRGRTEGLAGNHAGIVSQMPSESRACLPTRGAQTLDDTGLTMATAHWTLVSPAADKMFWQTADDGRGLLRLIVPIPER